MSNRVYEYRSYKIALTEELRLRRETGEKHLTITSMADYCGVQRTYLSKMMNREGNLSEDQIFLASKYLGLSPEETDFLLLLRAASATEIPERRLHLESLAEKIRVQIPRALETKRLDSLESKKSE
jgi:transcriptional regulator with XRE-family HTH domain